MFVLISTMVMTHAYKETIPKGFLKKRMKYILIPYLVMATFYAGDKFYRFDWTIYDFARELGYNVIGQWHGYFILIIFQFYLLHLLFVKYMKRFKEIHVLTISFFISVGYWVSLYFYWIDYVNHSSYLALFFSRILFVGWFFYYVVAYYCGKHYERFIELLIRYWKVLLFGAIASLGLVQYVFHSGMLMRVTSAGFDVIPYTVLFFFVLFYFISKVKRLPKWVISISGYSFGIYLLHPFVQTMVSRTVSITETREFQYLMIQFIAGVVGPMVLIYLLSKWRFGAFIVGKTMGVTRKTVVKETEKSIAA